ncbi:hypothetical protein C8Q75DRAFT_732181 [Abortiporus biennis]|nr:hypothetical protein C8Q75DRAFT_732181 [Abortiporus biennis]
MSIRNCKFTISSIRMSGETYQATKTTNIGSRKGRGACMQAAEAVAKETTIHFISKSLRNGFHLHEVRAMLESIYEVSQSSMMISPWSLCGYRGADRTFLVPTKVRRKPNGKHVIVLESIQTSDAFVQQSKIEDLKLDSGGTHIQGTVTKWDKWKMEGRFQQMLRAMHAKNWLYLGNSLNFNLQVALLPTQGPSPACEVHQRQIYQDKWGSCRNENFPD